MTLLYVTSFGQSFALVIQLNHCSAFCTSPFLAQAWMTLLYVTSSGKCIPCFGMPDGQATHCKECKERGMVDGCGSLHLQVHFQVQVVCMSKTCYA